ncbi:hypothetical protein [Pseudomonas sp. NW5]|uniref:PA0061/PA0062 family lipoprotein n=1 Tax=Pseudomonas sp. NW5 TaxID=2934934 RepID=UPI0020205B86|nr:hypothetical protein [Pseudomonas sp. NW5]MCL7463267.1 hypothetical protein [Pseudomonas sp. NW5]
MRVLLVPLIASLLSACASPLPEADPQQAWVDFQRTAGELLMADRVDGQRTADGRYFQLSPGAHRLHLTYRFEEPIGPLNREPQVMFCYLRIDYPAFAAGVRYRIVARHRLLEPESWLEDAHGQRLADGKTGQCMAQ